MTPDRVLATLSSYQAQIRALLDQAEAILTLPTSELAEQAAQLRWQLLRVLRAYQIFKHAEIFDPLLRDATPSRARLAADMKARCTAIGEAYIGHTQEWTLSRSGGDWDLYRQRATIMLAQIADHLSSEARNSGILLRGIDRIRRA